MYRSGQCKEGGQRTGIDQCTEVVSVKSVVNVQGLISVQKWSV